MSLNQLISQQESKLKKSGITLNDKMNCLNCLIQFKRRRNPLDDDLYYLTKQFIVSYINGLSEKQFIGYDNVNVRKINNCSRQFDLTKRIALLRLAIRELKINQYEDEAKEIEMMINRLEVKRTWGKHGLKRPFKLLYHLTTYNFWTLLISLVSIPVFAVLALIPFENPPLQVFEVSYESISNISGINHISNCLLFFVSMDGLSLKPINFFGALIIFNAKLLLFILVINFFLDRILKYFNR